MAYHGFLGVCGIAFMTPVLDNAVRTSPPANMVGTVLFTGCLMGMFVRFFGTKIAK
jgi:hypothetical protein